MYSLMCSCLISSRQYPEVNVEEGCEEATAILNYSWRTALIAFRYKGKYAQIEQFLQKHSHVLINTIG